MMYAFKHSRETNLGMDINHDSCLQPESVTEDTNFILNITPGEGKKPEPFEKVQNSEELSFPHLFPSGRFGFWFRDKLKF